MTALRPIPDHKCREALERAAEQTGWADNELLIDTAAEMLTYFQGSDEAIEHARHYLRQAREARRQEAF